jgi:hypothetical protein
VFENDEAALPGGLLSLWVHGCSTTVGPKTSVNAGKNSIAARFVQMRPHSRAYGTTRLSRVEPWTAGAVVCNPIAVVLRYVRDPSMRHKPAHSRPHYRLGTCPRPTQRLL